MEKSIEEIYIRELHTEVGQIVYNWNGKAAFIIHRIERELLDNRLKELGYEIEVWCSRSPTEIHCLTNMPFEKLKKLFNKKD